MYALFILILYVETSCLCLQPINIHFLSTSNWKKYQHFQTNVCFSISILANVCQLQRWAHAARPSACLWSCRCVPQLCICETEMLIDLLGIFVIFIFSLQTKREDVSSFTAVSFRPRAPPVWSRRHVKKATVMTSIACYKDKFIFRKITTWASIKLQNEFIYLLITSNDNFPAFTNGSITEDVPRSERDRTL